MSVTIETITFSALTAQPYGYDEQNVRIGQTAKKWAVTGLLTPSEWLDLLDVYDTWRTDRIEDQDSFISNNVGTTVTLTGTGPDGQAWNAECWFTAAPSASQSGNKLLASVELVDAAEALECLLKEQESGQDQNIPDYGTITIGSTILALKKPVDSYGDGPALELTALGNHYLSGPLVVESILDVEGTTDLSGWDDIRAWYEDQIVAVPLSESFFPISVPSATAEVRVIGGIKTTVYTVSIQLKKVL